jgi:hypothetical protein
MREGTDEKEEVMAFCTNCGSRLEEGARFCSNCGVKVGETNGDAHASPVDPAPPPQMPVQAPVYQYLVRTPAYVSPAEYQQPAGAGPDVKTRHGFTTFWLWLCLIVDVLVALLGLLFPEVFVEIYPAVYRLGDVDTIHNIIRFVIAFFGLGTAAAMWDLLAWKQGGIWGADGFYLLIILQILGVIVFGYLSQTFIPQLISSIISTAIIYGVLHLRNAYGISAWEQLKRK